MDGVRRNAASDARTKAFGTVLFSDICGSSELGEVFEPEEFSQIVLEVKAVLEESITAFGGTLVQFQGDGILAVFGFPEAQEDAPRRAVRAALRAHERTRQTIGGNTLNRMRQIRLHTGVHSGVFVAHPGDQIDGRYILLGDTVNIAAHLCSAAGVDEILASDVSIGGVEGFFSTQSVKSAKLKGKKQQVAASLVLSETGRTTSFAAREASGRTQFVGRAGEMSELAAAARQAREGKLTAVSLIGEPGIGKTRLAKEAIGLIGRKNAICAEGYCEAVGATAPLQPILHILSDLLDLTQVAIAENPGDLVSTRLLSIDPTVLPHSDLLRQVLGLADEAAAKSLPLDAVASACADLCEALARKALLILNIDDWQWADDASRTVVSKILDQCADSAILLVTTSREKLLADPVLDQSRLIDVTALSLKDAATAIAKVSPVVPDGAIMERIYERSGGNPLFLEEIAFHLASGKLDALLRDNSLAANATLPSLIEARLAGLPHSVRDVVQTASVLGNVFETQLLEAVIGETAAPARGALMETGLFDATERDDQLRFKHGITRDVIYESMDLTARRACHLRAANAIRSRDPEARPDRNIEVLAYHYAGAGHHTEALEWAEAAAKKAMAGFSLDRARFQLVACVKALDNLEDCEETRRRFVQICDQFSAPCVYGPAQEHVDILERAVAYAVELGDVEALARIKRWIGYIHYVIGDQDKAVSYFEAASAGFKSIGEERYDVVIHANLGQAHGAACAYDDALTHLDAAITTSQRHRHNTNRVMEVAAYACAARALVLSDLGRFDEAIADIDSALNDYGGSSHVIEASVRNMSCTGRIWRGDMDFALEEAARARYVAERAGATYVLACSMGMLGYAECKSGMREAGLAKLRQTVTLFERRGLWLYSSLYYGWLGDALLEDGQFEEAKSQAEKALNRVPARDLFGEALAHRTLASIAAAGSEPDLDAANVHLELARQAATKRQSPHEMALTDLREAEIFRKLGRSAQAALPLERARAAFERMAMHWHDANASVLSATIKRVLNPASPPDGGVDQSATRDRPGPA